MADPMINPNTKAGMASQLAHYDDTANMRAMQQTFDGGDKGGKLGVSAVGRPSGAGYGSNLAQTDGTANLRANSQTYAAAMPTTPTGSVGPNLGASNYGNGVQKFSGQGVVASGPKAPQGVPAVTSE